MAKASETPPNGKLKRSELRLRLREITDEYRFLGGNKDGESQSRRYAIAKEMRKISMELHNREPLVEVTVGKSAHKGGFVVGSIKFPPGVHRVRATVAQHLLYLQSEHARIEARRLQQNGEDIVLPDVGSSARYADVNREI